MGRRRRSSTIAGKVSGPNSGSNMGQTAQHFPSSSGGKDKAGRKPLALTREDRVVQLLDKVLRVEFARCWWRWRL